MQEAEGDIWSITTAKDIVVITTNIGYRNDGRNPMGRGIAREAAKRYPDLPLWYGGVCRELKERTTPVIYMTPNNRWCKALLLVPTKEFLPEMPYASWRQKSSIGLIEYGLRWMAIWAQQGCPLPIEPNVPSDAIILVPSMGCQSGQLDERQVVPLMARYLNNRFVHVTYRWRRKYGVP